MDMRRINSEKVFAGRGQVNEIEVTKCFVTVSEEGGRVTPEKLTHVRVLIVPT